MTKIAKFYIEDIFEITGRGLAFAGRIVDGVVSKGNEVEFDINNNCRRREILGIEGIRHSNNEKTNIGLLIKCLDKEEVSELKNSKKDLTTINIYSNQLNLSELINWLSTKTIEHKILFNELLLSNLTVMNRAIWSNENTDEQSKLESLKWSIELSHRIWNIIFDLKRNVDNQSENRLEENISFYAKQSKELAGHLSATANSTVNRFYDIIEKNNAPQQWL
ncbi:hypothetical protein WJN01_15410 [Flavobacteriaceae bacterium SZ-1-7]|uniref:hypothetical protein n=1 Tax=Tamlana sedimenti TaxID=3134126 RepID=UPI0031235032